MKHNTDLARKVSAEKFSLSKKIILLAALLFLTTAFADTCPNARDIHSDGKGKLVTNSDWASTIGTNVALYPSSFFRADVTTSTKISPYAKQAKGKIVCQYNGNSRAGKGIVSMEKKRSSATINTSNTFWESRTSFDRNGGPFTIYTCFSHVINDCQFTLASVNANPNSTNPFLVK